MTTFGYARLNKYNLKINFIFFFFLNVVIRTFKLMFMVCIRCLHYTFIAQHLLRILVTWFPYFKTTSLYSMVKGTDDL